jgi:hypothetical protein
MNDLDDTQHLAVSIANGIPTVLSLLGEVYMIKSYFSFKPEQRTFSMKLVNTLVISNLFYSISNLLTYIDGSSTACFIEGFVRVLTSFFSIVWVEIILWVAYRQLVDYNDQISSIYRTLLIGTLLVALSPGFVAGVSTFLGGEIKFSSDVFGFCTVYPNVAFVTAAIPTIIGIAFTWTLAILIIIRLKKETRISENGREYKMIMRYPLILFICIFPGILNSFVTFLMGRSFFWLTICHIFFTRSEGWMNTLVYRTKKSPSANNRPKVIKMISDVEQLSNSELSMHLL